MSTAVVCQDQHLDRAVLVKSLAPGTDKRRLLDEIQALQVIRSKHVVQIYDLIWYGAGEIVGIVEEYLPGEDLTAVAIPSNELEFLRLAYPIAEGIADIHAHGRVHRDIKRQNMKFDAENCLKIFDFGLARDSASSSTVGSVGTLGYMAPELFNPDSKGLVQFTPAVDTFAFGATCLAVLLGKLPSPIRQSPPNLPSASVSFAPNEIGLSSDVVGMLDSCLNVDPRARPAMSQVKEALGQHLLKDRHRALLGLRGKTYTLDKKNREVSLSVKDQGSITVTYDGLCFRVSAVSGDVAINNLPASGMSELPGSCVIVLGAAPLGSRRTIITVDVAHPEVAL
ncbi:MAG: protein kinase domain-containing protein [Bradyrhizobium sp.]